MLERKPESHKGENGIITIIGGSRAMHGAPIFSALAAEATGVDLVFPCVPECHEIVTRQASLNFVVFPFRSNDLSKSDVSVLEDVVMQSSAVIIGPGLGEYETTQQALQKLILHAEVPMVLDASALQSWTFDIIQGKDNVTVTPHLGELGRMQGQILDRLSHEERVDVVSTIAKERKITMILKGATDIIACPENHQSITGGNAGLTVGGTGDVLAGCIGGLIAQGIKPCDACIISSTLIKQAANDLYKTKGYAFTATDILWEIPRLLRA